MSQSELPRRPRLAEHALPRRHVTDGEERVVLHDARSGRLLLFGAREWGLLACADGTRDLEGIVSAAARAGIHARVPALRAFLEQLHAAGLIAEGPPEAEPGPPRELPADAEPGPAEERLLDVLPDFSLHCDGGGSCCRIYGTVVFSPLETARARAALPAILDGGARPEQVFLPERGAGPCAGSAVALIDGRCAYLAASGRCALHEAAGEAGKPLGCRLFPATFVDDGERVRVSAAVECACVLASVGRAGSSPLVPDAWRVRGDLDPAVHVAELPDHVALRPGVAAPRGAFVAWSRCVAEAPPPEDVPAALWALAAAVERAGLDPAAARAALASVGRAGPGSLGPEDLRGWLAALAERARRRAAEDAVWRSQRDLARLATAWIADAASALLDPPAALRALCALQQGGADPALARSEAFYLRAVLHGHQLVDGEPLPLALRDRAVRLVVARAMGLGMAGPRDDPSCAHPLALVEAALRGHGLGAYVRDLPE